MSGKTTYVRMDTPYFTFLGMGIGHRALELSDMDEIIVELGIGLVLKLGDHQIKAKRDYHEDRPDIPTGIRTEDGSVTFTFEPYMTNSGYFIKTNYTSNGSMKLNVRKDLEKVLAQLHFTKEKSEQGPKKT